MPDFRAAAAAVMGWLIPVGPAGAALPTLLESSSFYKMLTLRPPSLQPRGTSGGGGKMLGLHFLL